MRKLTRTAPGAAIPWSSRSQDMVGRATYTVDWNTGATLAIDFVGQYTDICAAIS